VNGAVERGTANELFGACQQLGWRTGEITARVKMDVRVRRPKPASKRQFGRHKDGFGGKTHLDKSNPRKGHSAYADMYADERRG
jgi:hypothetical protein